MPCPGVKCQSSRPVRVDLGSEYMTRQGRLFVGVFPPRIILFCPQETNDAKANEKYPLKNDQMNWLATGDENNISCSSEGDITTRFVPVVG